MTEPTLDYTDVKQHPTDARSVDIELSGLQSDLDQLLTDIADADRAALTKLYGLVSARLFGIQMRILKNRELAEDALQETFIKVWNSAAGYRSSQGTPMAWLNSLARNQALDMLRRAGTRAAVNVKIPDLNVDAWRDKARHFPDEMAELDALTRCLQTLPEESQACIVGLYCEGHTQEEMSQALERPMGTVKSWIRRGLASLKECLDGQH